MGAKGAPISLAVNPVLSSPPFAAGRGDFQIQTATVEQPDGLLAGLGVTYRGIGQGHGGNFLQGNSLIPNIASTRPRMSMERVVPCWTENKRKSPQLRGLRDVIGLLGRLSW